MANANMAARAVRRFAESAAAAQQLLETAVRQLHLSARAYHRVQKLARTIADLAGSERIEAAHLAASNHQAVLQW
jgi:magnesium chelatase family protein